MDFSYVLTGEWRNVNLIQRNSVGGMGVGCDDLMTFCVIVRKVEAFALALWPSCQELVCFKDIIKKRVGGAGRLRPSTLPPSFVTFFTAT